MPARNRTTADRDRKRDLILDAARAVFESEGLEGASVRAIAARAGYTPAALYFHFESKEAIYAELLQASLAALGAALREAVDGVDGTTAFRRASMAFFEFYVRKPRELDLGFYLFRGGMKPAGLGAARDRELNSSLETALGPIADAVLSLGADQDESRRVVVDVFAHATGLLVLLHTGRIRMFGESAGELMARYVDEQVRRFT